MKTQSNTLVKVYAAAILVMIPLIAAAWLSPDFPMLLRQILLCVWGVGATLAAERLLFSRTWRQAWQAVGFVRARQQAVVAALLASLPMWLFLPLLAWLKDTPIQLRPDWPALLVGVILVNGITEEVLHRGFVFGHLQQEHSFVRAALLSALLFAAQHLYLVFSLGWTAGLASALLAALLTFPLVYSYARGGNSVGGPAILHTSSNAPMLILALPQSFVATALLPHMGVVLVSIYLVFLLDRVPAGGGRESDSKGTTLTANKLLIDKRTHWKIAKQVSATIKENFTMKTKLAILLVILLICSACSLQSQARSDTPKPTAEVEVTCPEPTEGLKQLKHAAQGYCLLYPADYLVVETSDTTTDLVLGSIMNHIDPRVGLTVEEAAGRTLEQVADQVVADYSIPGVESERTTTTLAGEAAVVLDHLPGQDFNRRVLLIHEGRLYHFFITPVDPAVADVFQKTEALYETIIGSFRFIPVVPGAPLEVGP